MAKIQINLDKIITADDKFVERKQAKANAVKQKLNEIIHSGFAYDFGPQHGIQHLQLRNETDKTNWLTAQSMYKAQIEMGNGAILRANFRTAENNVITLSFNDGYNLLLSLMLWAATLYNISWAKQDAIRAAQTDAELNLISVEEDWEL